VPFCYKQRRQNIQIKGGQLTNPELLLMIEVTAQQQGKLGAASLA
jgi:hypothetical protein